MDDWFNQKKKKKKSIKLNSKCKALNALQTMVLKPGPFNEPGKGEAQGF